MKSARGSAVLYILFWQMCCRSVGIKKGQYPDDSILTLILTWPIKAEQITHWSISPDMCFLQHASRQSSSYPNQLPVYKYYISIRPVGSAVPTVWVAFVLSMNLLYMLGCYLLRSNQMENLQFNAHYISETICHNERRKCVSVQADFFLCN